VKALGNDGGSPVVLLRKIVRSGLDLKNLVVGDSEEPPFYPEAIRGLENEEAVIDIREIIPNISALETAVVACSGAKAHVEFGKIRKYLLDGDGSDWQCEREYEKSRERFMCIREALKSDNGFSASARVCKYVGLSVDYVVATGRRYSENPGFNLHLSASSYYLPEDSSVNVLFRLMEAFSTGGQFEEKDLRFCLGKWGSGKRG